MQNRFFNAPTTALDDVTLLTKVPSIFAADHSHHRDEKHYKLFKTIDVIEALRGEGYFPVHARANGTRRDSLSNIDTRKHIVRFTHRDYLDSNLAKGEERPEIILTNSHDGSSSFRIMAGLFRKVCSNGMMAMQQGVEDMRVRHIGHSFDEVINASLKVASGMDAIMDTVNTMKGINLTEKQQKELAAEIANFRFGEKVKTPENLLTLRRYEDNFTPSLYNTFNIIQENMVKGGQRVTDRVMRPITNIDTDININRGMWSIAYNRMKELQYA
jgi:hypothetical protein